MEFPVEKLGCLSAKLCYGERVLSQRRKGPDVRIPIYLICLICFRLALAFGAEALVDDLILLERKSRNLPPIEAVPDEAAIAKLTARILMQMHYLHLQQSLDDRVSSQFLDRYLERLDILHIHFLQSDLQAFEQYRTTLDDLT